MSWTTAETTATTALKDALEEAGFTDGRDENASPDDPLYFRDFIDDSYLQSGTTYFLFLVEPEQRSVAGDNGKISYEVSFDCYLATTYPPENSDVVSLRESVEGELQDAGFIVRFRRSAFDPDLKLYLFQYGVSMEV